ncbi:trypco2 family protein [Streptomyces graminofaciens]|nr:trypco2 family protein [Streptomyces graminofaciens]
MSDADRAEQDGMDLADAITLLRDQVAVAQKRIATPAGTGDDPTKQVLFTLGEITVELGMELAHTREKNGGLRWSVVSLGGKKSTADRATHTVTVKLQPHQPGGGDIDVSDEE